MKIIFFNINNIMNIILPLGGLGSRFKKEGYTLPKPLIKILGKEMILYVIDNLKLAENDIIHIIYNPELDKYGFNELINMSKQKINCIKLNKQTEGASETILIGLNTLDENLLNRKCLLLDCDTFYTIDIISLYSNQNENAIISFLDKQDKAIFSYVKFDNNNIVTEIKEKQKISDYANTGCYCFKNGYILKQYCEKIMSENIRQNGEYYISCVIDTMIKDGHKFIINIIDQNNFNCVGTPLQLKLYCINNINKSEKLRICFDLDNTLVTSTIEKDYSKVKPIQKNIDYLKYLKSLGHEIIIYTARRMRTHNGNIGKLVKDIGKITLNNLIDLNIPYDEIYFGKPYADYYIDDKAINVYSDIEKDLGIYNNKIDERSFNQIIVSSMDIVIKKGNSEKLMGEIYWYKHIPNSIQDLFPVFIKESTNSYTIEKINGIALSYIHLKESLTQEILINFLNIINRIHNSNLIKYDNKSDNLNIYANYIPKIKERYKSYEYSKFKDNEKIYDMLIDYFEKYEENKSAIFSVIHGDPVFSNIIMTSNMEFKLIDMRGKQGDIYTIYGDKLYDYAKIYQSLIGYDEILLDKTVNMEYKSNLINIFSEYVINKFNLDVLKSIKMITNSLLFTLIPLHNNEKCIKYYNLIDQNIN